MQKNNFKYIKLFKSADSFKLGLSIALYYLILVLMTDGVIWQQSQKLGDFKWTDLVLYSLMSYPYWMLISSKGYLAEMVDLKSSFKWSNVDLLPISNVSFFSMTFLFSLLKMRVYQFWIIAFFITSFLKTHNFLISLLIVYWLLLGVLNLTLLKILFSYLSPRGYENLISSLFYSAFWVISGAAFPLSFLKISEAIKNYNPLSLVIGLPLEIILTPSKAQSLPLIGITIIGIIWCLLLFCLNKHIEEKWRSSFYV